MKRSERSGHGDAERFETRSARGTVALGKRLAGRFGVGDCVALVGSLGAGKTVLARGIAVGLGLAESKLVSSPTYVLVHEYACRVPLFHLDLYRMTDPGAELADLGFDEMLQTGVVLIEWADRAQEALPPSRYEIRISIASPTVRRFVLKGT